MSGVEKHAQAILDRHYLREPKPFDEDSCGHCRHEFPCPDRIAAEALLVEARLAEQHLEAMKPNRCRYVSIGSQACDKSPGYPREQWCYVCDHREHREAALAALRGEPKEDNDA